MQQRPLPPTSTGRGVIRCRRRIFGGSFRTILRSFPVVRASIRHVDGWKGSSLPCFGPVHLWVRKDGSLGPLLWFRFPHWIVPPVRRGWTDRTHRLAFPSLHSYVIPAHVLNMDCPLLRSPWASSCPTTLLSLDRTRSSSFPPFPGGARRERGRDSRGNPFRLWNLLDVGGTPRTVLRWEPETVRVCPGIPCRCKRVLVLGLLPIQIQRERDVQHKRTHVLSRDRPRPTRSTRKKERTIG